MKNVIAYVHTHWDREWYREFEEFRLRLIEVFDEILEMLETGELPCFYFDGQTAALEDYLEIKPEKTQTVKKFVKEKKLRIGPFYCSADSFLVSGECIYRNFELGMKKSLEFGESEFIGYLSDTFGHSQSIVYILKSLGINKACIWRGAGDLPADSNWNGINLTYLVQGYFQDFLSSNRNIKDKAESLKKYIDKIAAKSGDYVLLPVGADHLAAGKNLQGQISELNKIYKDCQIKLSDPFEYFDKITDRVKVSGEFLNNKTNFILPGVYSSRLYLKQENARSQFLLSRIAEPLQAIAGFYFGAGNKQNEIDYAYKTLIKNHAHDSIYGCSVDEVHKEVMRRFHNVNTICDGIIKRSCRDISSDNGILSVFNLSKYPYSGKIKIKTEKKLPSYMNAVKINSEKGFTDKKLYDVNDIPVTEDITGINEYIVTVKNLAPFSLTNITEDKIQSENYLKADEKSIENKFIKIEVINGKVNITDKIKGEKYEDFVEIINFADVGDSYNFGALKEDIPVKGKLKNVKLKENNSQRAILNLIYEIFVPANSSLKGRSKKTLKHIVNIDAVLYNLSEFVEFDLSFENKSKNSLFQITFNLNRGLKNFDSKIYETLNEDLFGTVKRQFNPDYDIRKDIPAPRGIELKPNTSPLQRFMQTGNFALITKGNTEYEINGSKVGLTLLRATGVISNPKNPTRGTPAGPPLEVPDLQCLGKNSAEFAIAFTNDENKLFALADEFYEPYVPLFTDLPDTKFFNVENENILVYAVKRSEEGLLIRCFNKSDEIQTYERKEKITFAPEEIKNVVIKS